MIFLEKFNNHQISSIFRKIIVTLYRILKIYRFTELKENISFLNWGRKEANGGFPLQSNQRRNCDSYLSPKHGRLVRPVNSWRITLYTATITWQSIKVNQVFSSFFFSGRCPGSEVKQANKKQSFKTALRGDMFPQNNAVCIWVS